MPNIIQAAACVFDLPWAVNILPAFLVEMAVGKLLPHPLSLSQSRAPTL